MRAPRIASPAQLMLSIDDRHAESTAIWSSLSDQTRQAVPGQLARLIRGGPERTGSTRRRERVTR